MYVCKDYMDDMCICVHSYAIPYFSRCTIRYTNNKYTQRPTNVRVRVVLGRVRDRACACTDALHNIFAIVKCKVPARERVPLSQLFLASRSHTPLRNSVYVCVCICVCVERACVVVWERKERSYGCAAKARLGRDASKASFCLLM